MTRPQTPIPLTDLRGMAPAARRQIAELLTRQLGEVQLDYDFYREWNGGWFVRVTVAGAARGQIDFALLQTPGGGLLPLPRPMPERWRRTTGVPASDGSVWTLDDEGQLVPFAIFQEG